MCGFVCAQLEANRSCVCVNAVTLKLDVWHVHVWVVHLIGGHVHVDYLDGTSLV